MRGITFPCKQIKVGGHSEAFQLVFYCASDFFFKNGMDIQVWSVKLRDNFQLDEVAIFSLLVERYWETVRRSNINFHRWWDGSQWSLCSLLKWRQSFCILKTIQFNKICVRNNLGKTNLKWRTFRSISVDFYRESDFYSKMGWIYRFGV